MIRRFIDYFLLRHFCYACCFICACHVCRAAAIATPAAVLPAAWLTDYCAIADDVADGAMLCYFLPPLFLSLMPHIFAAAFRYLFSITLHADDDATPLPFSCH